MRQRIAHVVGARPNFPKAAPVIAALDRHPVDQVLIHTGQHYDDHMSKVFIDQLGMPVPDHNLGVGSGTHAKQTAAVMVAIEELFTSEPVDLVVVYGDINSTLASALVTAKMQIPLAHVEAGLRSFDMAMPEEVNRLVVDRLADIHLVTSPEAIAYLAREGVAADKLHFVGNPMIDSLLRFRDTSVALDTELPECFVAATLHRPGNVDSPAQSAKVIEAMHQVADEVEIVIPLHPRGRERLEAAGLLSHQNILVIDPLPYREFLELMQRAAAVITDSGGVQEETTVLGVPCFTLRPNTERPITITHGTNQLVEPDELPSAVLAALASTAELRRGVPPLWDGRAGERIATVLVDYLNEASGQ